MYENMPKNLLKTLALTTITNLEVNVKKLLLYLWLEFQIVVHIKPIISKFEVEIIHKGLKVNKKPIIIKDIKDIKKLIDKQIKEHLVKKKEIDKYDK